MFIAVSCRWVYFAMYKQWVIAILGKLYGALRTVLYAGETELTVTLSPRSIRRISVSSSASCRATYRLLPVPVK